MPTDTEPKKKSNTTLVAKTRVKFGGEGHMDPRVGFVRTEAATEIEPGDEFEIDGETGADLVAAGAAMTRSDYDAEQKSMKTNAERAEELRAEIGNSEIAEKARAGDSVAINSNAHLDRQKKEDAAVEAAQKKGKGRAADKDDDKGKK